ncbi:MAG: hypothetical protein ABH851_05625 [Methanobacteriota archaeon]
MILEKRVPEHVLERGKPIDELISGIQPLLRGPSGGAGSKSTYTSLAESTGHPLQDVEAALKDMVTYELLGFGAAKMPAQDRHSKPIVIANWLLEDARRTEILGDMLTLSKESDVSFTDLYTARIEKVGEQSMVTNPLDPDKISIDTYPGLTDPMTELVENSPVIGGSLDAVFGRPLKGTDVDVGINVIKGGHHKTGHLVNLSAPGEGGSDVRQTVLSTGNGLTADSFKAVYRDLHDYMEAASVDPAGVVVPKVYGYSEVALDDRGEKRFNGIHMEYVKGPRLQDVQNSGDARAQEQAEAAAVRAGVWFYRESGDQRLMLHMSPDDVIIQSDGRAHVIDPGDMRGNKTPGDVINEFKFFKLPGSETWQEYFFPESGSRGFLTAIAKAFPAVTEGCRFLLDAREELSDPSQITKYNPDAVKTIPDVVYALLMKRKTELTPSVQARPGVSRSLKMINVEERIPGLLEEVEKLEEYQRQAL